MAKQKEKVTVSIGIELLAWIDGEVERGTHGSRSLLIEASIAAYREQLFERQLMAAFESPPTEEELKLAEAGVEAWGAALDAFDGGYGSDPSEAHGVARAG